YGFWGEELIGPLEALESAGYEVVFVTPRGQRPVALPPSMDEKFLDPPLGRGVTSAEMAAKVRAINGSPRLDKMLDLSKWFPERPYYSAPLLVRELEKYYNQRVHDLILGFYNAGKPIAAECYGVACLAFARNLEDRKSIIKNKHVTGHC